MKAKFVLVALASAAVCCVALDPVCPEANDPEHVVHYPHLTDCSKFLTCDWGKLVEQNCPPGLLWNDEKKLCDFPQNVNCEAQFPHTSTVTPANGKCPEHFNPDQPTFLPHEDCTKFYICIGGGEVLERECSGGLHWNPTKNLCDNPEEAGCVPEAGSTSPQSDKCPEVYDQNHQVYFPHADCTKYYICTYEGNKLEQNCPLHLHWAQHLGYCDRPEVAQCNQVPSAPYVSLVPTVLRRARAISASVPLCHLSNGGMPVFLPHEDCTKYYVCVNLKPVEMNCPGGTFWNAHKYYCDAPDHSGCKQAGVLIRV